MSPSRHTILVRDGLRIAVTDRGSGSAAVLLHGLGGSAASWGGTILDALTAEHRVLAVDLLGHGGSDGPDDPNRYAIDAIVADVCDVLDTRGVPRASWIGYSMGGRVALAAAVQRPDSVSHLVLESASPGLADPTERAARRRDDEAIARRLLEEGIEAFVDAWEEQPLFAGRRALGAATRAALRTQRLSNEPLALAACLRGLGTGAQPSLWDALPGIEAPTLVVTGSDDTKFTEIGRRMAAALPAATHSVVSGAGHTVHLEQPDAWLRAIVPFLLA